MVGLILAQVSAIDSSWLNSTAQLFALLASMTVVAASGLGTIFFMWKASTNASNALVQIGLTKKEMKEMDQKFTLEIGLIRKTTAEYEVESMKLHAELDKSVAVLAGKLGAE